MGFPVSKHHECQLARYLAGPNAAPTPLCTIRRTPGGCYAVRQNELDDTNPIDCEVVVGGDIDFRQADTLVCRVTMQRKPSYAVLPNKHSIQIKFKNDVLLFITLTSAILRDARC